MKSLKQIKTTLNNHKQVLAAKYGLKEIAIFGSYGRGDQTEVSDIDILVEFDRPIGLDFVTFGDELEEILGVKVDVVTKNGLSPRMYNSIQSDITYV